MDGIEMETADDPIALFVAWMEAAEEGESNEPGAGWTGVVQGSREGVGEGVPAQDSAAALLERIFAAAGADRVLEEWRGTNARSNFVFAERRGMAKGTAVPLARA